MATVTLNLPVESEIAERIKKAIIIIILFTGTNISAQSIPYLKKQGSATQLMVGEKPFLLLGGELGNSVAADSVKIKFIFPQLKVLNLNTVLAPVYWELMEPKEGRFDFALIDVLIREARKEELKLVLLWFGSWKNSMSCYAPSWVKSDRNRFPYTEKSDGKTVEIMTAFSEENLNADKKAYIALMQHIKEVDSKENTVIMMQVENEIGMIPEAREQGKTADAYFKSDVPARLINYLKTNRANLQPHLSEKWSSSGYALKGNWETLFGSDIYTDELFQAWYFARYTEEITRAGKSVYNLPVFVNAALNTRKREPGAYPAGGPLPHLLDIWRAGAPSIDFIAPDIYDPPFDYWCGQYHAKGNPLFIPETLRGDHTAARVFYAFGEHDAMGFCPFAIELTDNPLEEPLRKSYELLDRLSPLLLSVQGKNEMKACWLHPENLRATVELGDYVFHISHDYTLSWSPGNKETKENWPETGALIIRLAGNEFIVAGTGIVIRPELKKQRNKSTGLLSCDKGTFENRIWIPIQRLNGDETHQGRHVRIPYGEFDIQRFSLYEY